MFLGKTKRIHFIGIGGSGMSGIAEVLINQNYEVSGSDQIKSSVTDHLESLGADIQFSHKPENVLGKHVVVVSSAIQNDNSEVQAAKKQMIPVIRRAEMLAELMRMKHGIAIAGTHGKTTTTSLVATVLVGGHLDPTVIVGGKLKNMGGHAKLGQSKFLVAEADESDGSFLRLSPTLSVVTTLDAEHMDYYQTMQNMKSTFRLAYYLLIYLLPLDNHHTRIKQHQTFYNHFCKLRLFSPPSYLLCYENELQIQYADIMELMY